MIVSFGMSSVPFCEGWGTTGSLSDVVHTLELAKRGVVSFGRVSSPGCVLSRLSLRPLHGRRFAQAVMGARPQHPREFIHPSTVCKTRASEPGEEAGLSLGCAWKNGIPPGNAIHRRGGNWQPSVAEVVPVPSFN